MLPPAGPPRFSARELRLIRRLRTPSDVQRYVNALPYNTEPPPDPATLRTFRGVVRHHTAHCLEAALTAAVILEQHGFPPTVMSLDSIDGLDHVIFVYRERGRWGSVARSRDPGLHGRRPVFRTLRQLARTYFTPFIDKTGCLRAFGVVDLRVLGGYDWRLSAGNVWKVEQLLFQIPHEPLPYSRARERAWRRRYFAFIGAHPGCKPTYYDQRTWSEWPRHLYEHVRS
jgi:hypothetical protein